MSGRHMALTMRPTDLDRSPATADLDDWIVLDDGRPIGRIYQRHAGKRGRGVVLVDYYLRRTARGAEHKRMAETLDAAKTAFRDSYDKWRDWATQAGFDSSSG
jgi:hypothetical protein